jgi:hypothetical protein
MGVMGFLGSPYCIITYTILTNLALNPCPVSEKNYVKLSNQSLCGFLLLVLSCHSCETTY